MKKSFCELSIDTQMCIERIVEMEMSEVVKYDVFSELIGRNVTMEARGILWSARNVAERDHLTFTDCVAGEGVKRITEAEALNGRTAKVRESTRRKWRRLRKTLERITDDKLSREDIMKRNAELAFCGTMDFMSKPKAIEALREDIGDRQVVSAGTTLEILRKIG